MPETTLTRISDHVYWMSPGKPDRPSLAAVVGAGYTLMLDAGASAKHARLFRDALAAEGVGAPRYIALTHWHWDHVFGAAEIGVPIIAHQQTAARLAVLSGYDWNDSALDQRVASGEEIISCASDIKIELPEPRDVQIVMPDLTFEGALEIHLGGVTCSIQHVGGDHAADSCVMTIAPDRVVFLGDCLYDAIYAPVRHLTTGRLFPLLDTIEPIDADFFIEGHNPSLMTRADLQAMMGKMQLAGSLVERIGTDEAVILAAARAEMPPDEDMNDFVRAFIAGKQLESAIIK